MTSLAKFVSLIVVLVVVNIGLSLCGNRRYVYSNEEIELTKQVVIDPKHCNTGHDLIIVISSGTSGNFNEYRQQLRSGWIGTAKSHNIGVWFALAVSDNKTVNEKIKKESDTYHDIIQFNIIDDYYNLTLRGIAIQRWVQKYCQSVKYFLKADDLVFVDVDHLLKVLPNFKTGINGITVDDRTVNRQPTYRWHVPIEYYSLDKYPEYHYGSAIIVDNVTRNQLLTKLDEYRVIPGNNVLDVKDVSLWGIIANWAGIPRHNSSHFAYDDCLCIPRLHTVPIHYDCRQRTDTWRDFLDKSKNTNAYCNHKNVSSVGGYWI
ncbi:N-acetyllactosaminide beta-1,3-N-acetylglucosaminyltransferase 4-like [Oppia nitens]|uniref:N-acetyllactosaminide beta-1,3-N-acetylglucosaminyltransferase 4-like n=1 Tax=Oppia nitens TaxID=1686743 RepID=UPI0023DC9B40|nr:N-acetyllactosaminide beta-1,3-N-acetylglucosaminyltransferase 4-like [Oppia nitens]